MWLLEASEREVLDILLCSKFFNITELDEGRWLISANVRTIVELVSAQSGPLFDALSRTLREVAPSLYESISKGSP